MASAVRAVLLRLALVLHTIGAAAFWMLQPRGFSFPSRSFVEHELVAPALFLASLLATAAPFRMRRTWALAVGFLAGYWAVTAATTAVLSGGVVGGVFGLLALGAISAGLLLFLRTLRGYSAGGFGTGMLLATAFLACTWAPPASTHPTGYLPPPPPDPQTGTLPLSLRGRWIVVGDGDNQLLIDPGFSFDSASSSGYWTVFDFKQIHLTPWATSFRDASRWELQATANGMEASVLIWTEPDGVHLRATTLLRSEVASHLSTVMTIIAPDAATIDSQAWPAGDHDEPAQFVAFRGNRVQFLRASSKEKGPFTALGDGAARDPWIETGPWRIQVRGWADQASREESPTAGWGVSQGAIERWNGVFTWSLAATSVGRGWHAVRTKAGVYVLEAVIGRKA